MQSINDTPNSRLEDPELMRSDHKSALSLQENESLKHGTPSGADVPLHAMEEYEPDAPGKSYSFHFAMSYFAFRFTQRSDWVESVLRGFTESYF